MSDDIWTGETILTTDRLILRLFRRGDIPLYQAICADPEVMRFLGGVWSSERTEATMGRANRGARGGEGMVAVERKSDGVFLGAAGLGVEKQWYPDDLQVGWRLIPAHWGHGYASEAGRAWLGYGFDVLGQGRIIAMADTPNHRSIAVMQRLGMVFDHEATLTEGDDVFDATIYAITAERWRAAIRT